MNSRTISANLRSSCWLGWCAIIAITATASAQTQRYYPQPQGGAYPPQQPQYSQPAPPPGYQQQQPRGYAYPPQPQPRYESPIQFLPKFGKRMSEMVRRLFYGQDPTGYDYPPPGYGTNGGRNLDADPRQYQAPNYPQQPAPGYQYPQQQGQPRYSYPPQPNTPTQGPQPQTKSATPPPAAQNKTPSPSSTRKYSPPKVSETPSRTPDKPSATVQKKEIKPDLPPPTTPTMRRSETTPKEPPATTSSGGSGSFLKGKKTSKPGRVISPYPPYKELDITGLESGSLALDPTTQKVFEVP
ncbi:hypothetical protein [Prosthecobacter sp.]|uniref:hypothetical protein n=1 Tax=Prosthecobacter sp. TaxID=1965333 RepID=UPI001D2A3607|nr:hypothetical protein [Prosthecobacter sp.]MCB1275931.1 hypothetical protein [Prosthecobacter sp.]